jgi:cobalt-zinc-cadmium efflux system protein
METGIGGSAATEIIDGCRRIPVVVRLAEPFRATPEAIGRLLLPTPSGATVPLSSIAQVRVVDGPELVTHENGERVVLVQSNVRGRDLGGFAADVERAVAARVHLPAGYAVILAHSLALLSDAAHMLTDAGAFVLSLVVIRYMRGTSPEQLTYGRRRAEVLSGQANGAVLLVLAALVGYEAVVRLLEPPAVAGFAVTAVAAVGVVLNIAAAWILAKANRQSLNVEGSFQHIVTDLYAFIGTLVAGLVIVFTGFNRADAIASLAVAALMIRSGVMLQRKAIRVLLESAPEGMAPAAVGRAMTERERVLEVRDLHLWELAPGHPILTAHVFVNVGVDCHAERRELEAMLRTQFGIAHTTHRWIT